VTDLLTAALDWHDAGYCVIPAHEDGSKRPFAPWKQYQVERPSREQVAEWFSSGHYTGVGIITGQASGNVEMVEVENRAIVNGSLEFLGDISRRSNIDHIWNTALRGCAEQSGGGGVHMFIRLEDQAVPGNLKLAANRDNEVLAETRGEGGFVIVAPTPPRTGHHNAYTLLPGSNPARTPTLTSDERDELHNLLRTLDDAPTKAPEPAPSPRPNTPHTGLTPADDYNASTDWSDILIPAGWTRLNSSVRAGHPITWWTRPGKNEGVSASTGGESDWLYVFTTSTDLPDNEPLNKFYVYAHYHHDGDMSAAAKQLARDGYGTPLTPLTDLAPWEYEGATIDGEHTDEADAWVSEHLQQIDWHALWEDQTEEEWIVEPLLPARRLIALYSAPKVGKSLLMLEMAAAIATGTEVLGTIPKQRHVLYVDFENDPKGDIKPRLVDMGYEPSQLDWLHYLSFPTLAALDSERGSKELLAAVHHFEAEAVFVDTVSRSVQGEENENDTWLNFYRHTGLKLKQAQVALMRLDHSGKDETKGQRGGSAKVGDVDAVWRMRRVKSDDGDTYLLECEAHRFQLANGSDKVMVERHTGPLRHLVKGGKAQAYVKGIEFWARELDNLGCALDIGRRSAREELKNAGHLKTFTDLEYPEIQAIRQATLKAVDFDRPHQSPHHHSGAR
jgi:hypothetical protein